MSNQAQLILTWRPVVLLAPVGNKLHITNFVCEIVLMQLLQHD